MQLRLFSLPVKHAAEAEVEMNALFAFAPGAGGEEGVPASPTAKNVVKTRTSMFLGAVGLAVALLAQSLPRAEAAETYVAFFGPVTVDTRGGHPPQLTAHPSPLVVAVGGSPMFRVTATGSEPLSYQWRKDGVELVGATAATLALSRVTLADAGLYSVEVRNLWGWVRSLPVGLRVGMRPEILGMVPDQLVAVGAVVELGVHAQGTKPLSYQWRKDGSDLAGATGPELRLGAVTLSQAGEYEVEVSNGFGSVRGGPVRLQVLMPPRIVSGPVSQVSEPGGTMVLRVEVSGDEPLRYQWQLNGTTLEGATDSTLVLEDVQWGDSGRYSVVVSNPVGAVESDPAEVQVGTTLLGLTDGFGDRPAYVDREGIGRGSTVGATREAGEPWHGEWPEGASVWMGWQAPASGILRVSTRGSGFDTVLAVYAGERVDALGLVGWDDDSGPYLTSYLAVNVVAGRVYNVVVDGHGGQSGSVVLGWGLEVTEEVVPVIVREPESVTVGEGQPAGLSVEAGPVGVGYQWFKDGTVIAGATRPQLSFGSVQRSDIANYQVRVSLDGRSTLSAVAAVQVNRTDGAVATQARSRNKLVQPGPATGGIARQDGRPRKQRFVPPVRGWVGSHEFSTVGHRKEPGEPNHGKQAGGASAWYSIQAERGGWMLVTTEGSTFDTVLAVYSGPAVPAGFEELRLLGEDDNGGVDGVSSRVVVEVVADRYYHIAVDGVNGASGQVRLWYEIGQVPRVVRGLEEQRPLVGQPLTLSVEVASEVAVVYEWWRDGVYLGRTSEGELDLGAAVSAANGEYTVRVSNHAGEQEIGPARVQVLGPEVLRFGAGTSVGPEGYRIEVERPLAGRLVVERSWDMVVWEEVWSAAPLEEKVVWIDQEGGPAGRFYRCRLEP